MPKIISKKPWTPKTPYEEIEDSWARTWGETTNKTDAAKMLGISRKSVYNMLDRGELKKTFDGRILVREACMLTHQHSK